MKVKCPTCRKLIPTAQLNVAKDVALCVGCGEAFALSQLVGGDGIDDNLRDFDVNDPPPGAWYEDTGVGWRVGASTRSWGAWFLVPFMCVWSGGSLGGIYGSQIAKGEFNLVLSLFGIPFLLGSLLFGTFALMMIFGRTFVSVERGEGRIFTGIGPFGWRRYFDWQSITAIEEVYTYTRHPGSNGTGIVLLGQRRITIGTMLNENRRYYMLQVLRMKLANCGD